MNKAKIKTQTKELIIKSFGYLTIILITASIIDYALFRYIVFNLELSHKFWSVPVYEIPTLIVPRVARAEVKEESKIIYSKKNNRTHRYLTKYEKKMVLDMVEKAGLNREQANCLIINESSWDSEGWLLNKDGWSIDRGLWAINSFWHYEVSNACSYDMVCSTKEAIRIRKANGNWNQWHGYTKNCI